MKPVFVNFDYNSSDSLYVQLYDYLRQEIVCGTIQPGEKLPSLRALSKQIGVSITTCSRAYDQLLIEGYVDAKPQSGYYVSDFDPDDRSRAVPAGRPVTAAPSMTDGAVSFGSESETSYYRDPECFDFVKWRKCAADVMTERVEDLLIPADPQGEYDLRREIERYLYTARGVSASPEQIVISAGVQQLTSHLARILSYLKIDLVNVEDPGYKPVRHIFRDRGFTINKIPVDSDGIEIERLPVNLASAVYVSPSNQFPTGSVMPAARRYKLLRWAEENGSIIIEDDYDSELRYFGDPVPALKSLDDHGCAVYLGSFSSTLFPAIRISYMVLPERLAGYFNEHKNDYDQTCSKIEQLTLASFMARGFYQQGIRKLRKLYSKKLALVIKSFKEYGGGFAQAENTRSGISVRLNVKSEKTETALCREAGEMRLHMIPFEDESSSKTIADPATDSAARLSPGAGANTGSAPGSAAKLSYGAGANTDSTGNKQISAKRLLFYYDQIPEDSIEPAIRELCKAWQN